MGRYIDLNKPLNDEDRAFLLARSREGDVDVNDRQFGHLSDEDRAKRVSQAEADADRDASDEREAEQEEIDNLPPFDEDLIDKVAPLKVAELRAHLEKRGLDAKGDKETLQDRLLVFLQGERDAAAVLESDDADDVDDIDADDENITTA